MAKHHEALIYTMVMVSAADRNMTDAELQTIGDTVKHLPIFEGFEEAELSTIARACAELLNQDDGFEQVMDFIDENLPERANETAYALSCDVAAVDGRVSQEELQLLEAIRHRLRVGRLPAAAIERGARARYIKL